MRGKAERRKRKFYINEKEAAVDVELSLHGSEISVAEFFQMSGTEKVNPGG